MKTNIQEIPVHIAGTYLFVKWTLLILIPAICLARICWATATFVDNPVDYEPIVQVNVPHIDRAKTLNVYTPEQAKERIREIAKERNFSKTEKLLAIIDCESKFNQFAYNVNKDGSVDRGIMQWNSYWHSKMTNEQAFDLDYAVNKAMDYFEKNSESLWICNKFTN